MRALLYLPEQKASCLKPQKRENDKVLTVTLERVLTLTGAKKFCNAYSASVFVDAIVHLKPKMTFGFCCKGEESIQSLQKFFRLHLSSRQVARLSRFGMEPASGVEPLTCALRVRCSAC